MEVRRNVGESSCNSGDGTDQRIQSLMFIMMINWKGLERALLAYFQIHVPDNTKKTIRNFREEGQSKDRNFNTDSPEHKPGY